MLQVPFGAKMPQIRQAYRKLVLQYHPDRNPSPAAHDMFLQIQAAYEYLQRFEGVPGTQNTAPPSRTASPPPKPISDWERYQHVFEPPRDPKEYNAWAAVARERVRRQKAKDHAAYVKRTLAMKKKWWYGLARGSSYVVLVLGWGVGILFMVFPVWFVLTGQYKASLLGVFMLPMGYRMIGVMRDFRKDIRRHFGEDLREET